MLIRTTLRINDNLKRLAEQQALSKNTTLQNIFNDAILTLENILDACNIVSPDYKTHRIALGLIQKYKITSNRIYDAYITATMLSNDIHMVATDNIKDFNIFTEIQTINPFT